MKAKTILALVSLSLIAAMNQTLAAGHGGGGGGFGGGHFGGGGFGGGHFGGGGGFHVGGAPMGGFHNTGVGGPGGVRYSFGTRPTYGRPVYVGPRNGITGSGAHSPAVGRQQASASSAANRLAPFYHLPGTTRSPDRPVEPARNHVYARHDFGWHRDWDRHGAHYWNGHWWAWDGYDWLGLDAGFFPWDYFPYYAYDYYPYDYYPGYYADVEPYYSNDGISDYTPTPDPNVVAVQNDLANLGYYHGSIDGIYGRDTRDAVARYQTDHNLTVTGTLTTQTLQSLGVSQATPS